MRGKSIYGGLGAMAMFAFMACPCVAEEDASQPRAPEGAVAIQGSKKTVMFEHGKGHKGIECVVCHHAVNGRRTFAKCADAGCHDDLTAKKGEKSLYLVMHSKSEALRHQTCMSCHVKTVAEKPDIKKAMTGCTQSYCHPAKKDDKPAGEAKS